MRISIVVVDADRLVDVVALSRLQPDVAFLRSSRFLVAGCVVLVAVALAAIPSFVSAVADIARRQP